MALGFALAAILLPSVGYAATLSLSPSSGSYGVGKTFTVNIMADSGSDSFNSANATINFDKDLLSVQTVSKIGSALSLWAVEPKSSNTGGTVNFEGGNTSALAGKQQLISITFKALKEGKASVTIASGSVLAADGKGTDILKDKGSASYDLAASSPPTDTSTPSDASPPSDLNVPLPDLPVITSTSHPDENKWSLAKKAKLAWDLPPDVTVVRLALDTNPKTVPTTTYDPAITDKEFDSLTQGTMWFHLRYKNDGGWGPTAHRKLMIDTDPPQPFTLETKDPKEQGGEVTLVFSATDTLSGIDHYEISVDGSNPLKIDHSDVPDSGYILKDQTPGDHSVSVKAFDAAGNSAEAQAKFTIPGTIKTASAATQDETQASTNWTLIGFIAMVALSAFLLGFLILERRGFRHEKYVAKRESDEVRDIVGNIFAALREEVGEQTGQLFQRPNPSAQDREVMMRINEAIDLSEELIAKEVEDVRKILM